MFSVITNIYNKEIKGPTLAEFFTARGKLKKVFFLTTRDVPCVHHWWHGTHRYDIQVVTTHASLVHTSNISSCQKKKFQFSCGCEKFHYGRSFGFLVINVCNHGEHYETPCMCVCIYIYIYTHTYIYIYTYTHTHTYIHTYTHMCVCVCVCVCAHARVQKKRLINIKLLSLIFQC